MSLSAFPAPMGKVVVFSITGCPHCRAAKAVLKRHGAPFHNVNLDDYPSRRKEVVLASGGKKTVPQVFFNATHIGGSTELQALAERGQLSAMLSALADEPDAPGRPLTTEECVHVCGVLCDCFRLRGCPVCSGNASLRHSFEHASASSCT